MLKKLLLVTMIGLSFSISIYANEIDDLMVKAEQGDEQALFDLALKYYHGDGVKQAYKQATYWYQQAAEQGVRN